MLVEERAGGNGILKRLRFGDWCSQVPRTHTVWDDAAFLQEHSLWSARLLDSNFRSVALPDLSLLVLPDPCTML